MATGKSSQEIYILLQELAIITNSPSVKRNFFKRSLKTKKKVKNKSAQYVPAGSLLRKDLDTEKQEVYLSLSEGCSISCASSAVAELSDEEYKLLEGIHPCAERIKRYNLKTKGSSSWHTWRHASDPEEDDDRKYLTPETSSPTIPPKTPIERYKPEPTCRGSDDEDEFAVTEPHYVNVDRSKVNIPPDEGSDVEDICIDDEHYFSDVPGQVRETIPVASDEEEEADLDPDLAAEPEPHYVNLPLLVPVGETIPVASDEEEEADLDPDLAAEPEPLYVNLPLSVQVRETIPVASDEEEEADLDPDLAVETEPIYVNLPHPVQVTNGTQQVGPPEESRATNDQSENAGAVASTDKDEYGRISLSEHEHHYERIPIPTYPDDIFDQTYPLDPEQQYTGTCLIINQFTHDREGSNIDVRTIHEVFEEKFKFRIVHQSNLSKKEFLGTFKEHHDYMANPDNRVQRFICFILGHGDEKGIMTCVGGLGSRFHAEEGARIDVNIDLLPFLSSSNLKTMAGKPKLMFIQACRGRAFQGGHRVQGEADPHDGIGETVDLNVAETIPPPHVSIPNDSDILVAYAQTPGKQAFRDMRVGSWFIQAVTDIFRDYHERYDVLSMMTMVSNAVSSMSRQNPDGSEHKQSPIIQHTLRKKMFMLRASA